MSDRTDRELTGVASNAPRETADLPVGWFLILVLLVGAGLAYYVGGQITWLPQFSVALVQWLAHPTVAGPLVIPAGSLKVAADLLLPAVSSWLLSEVLLSRSVFARSWASRIGLTLVLLVALTGFVGMLMVVVAQVTVPMALLLQILVLLAIAVTWHLTSDTRKRPLAEGSVARSKLSGAYRWLRIGAIAVAALTFVFTVVHAAMSPVVEWDATIYHAASARFWYFGRPSPPLMYGPSIGIESSYNYPPLFPAAGLVTDLIGGGFHDLYLRLASPTLLAALFMLTFGYTRQRFGEAEASWALLLASGSPLLVLYGVWTTDYMLLAALAAATFLLVDAAFQHSSVIAWVSAGVVGGLALLTNLIGLMVPGIGLLAVLLSVRPSRWVRYGSCYIGTCLVVASPWLLRNWIISHDPIYPLAGSLFHGVGLASPVFAASEAGLKISALREWAGTRLPVRLAELGTALVNKNMLAIGVAPGVLYAGWRARNGDRRFAWFGLACICIIGILLAPGWYWVRYLMPLLCVSVVLGACLLARLPRAGRSLTSRPGPAGKLARIVVPATLALTAVASGAVAVGLSLAGPGQHNVWTTESFPVLTSYIQGLRYLGSDSDILWSTDTGDYLAWQWINRRIPAEQKIATLEDRTYYLDNPDSLFYLDGSEAAPLRHISKPGAILRFLRARGVEWVLISEWDKSPRTEDPALKLLPMDRLLGGRYFPLREVFSVNALQWLTSIYHVGGRQTTVTPAVFPGFTSPPPHHGLYAIEPGVADDRLYIPSVDEKAGASFSFAYRQNGGSFRVRYQLSGSSAWHLLAQRATKVGSGWHKLRVLLPSHVHGQLQMLIAVSGKAVLISHVGAT